MIVNGDGDLIVRPSHLETSLLQHMRGGSGRHHTTVEYQRSMLAVVAAQLRACSRHSDGLHGLLGLLKGVPQVRRPVLNTAACPDADLPFRGTQCESRCERWCERRCGPCDRGLPPECFCEARQGPCGPH